MRHAEPPQAGIAGGNAEPAIMAARIQPIGFLVALSSDWMVCHVSANIGQFIGKQPDELVGKHVNTAFCPDAVHSIRNRLALLRDPDAVERMFGCSLLGDGRRFDIALHISGGRVILEAEPFTERAHGDPTGTVRSLIGRLDRTRDFHDFLTEGARQMRALTGFDRVLIYRLTANGPSEVIAESARSGIGAHVETSLPADDIPIPVHELSKRNILRVITDTDADPVALIPPGDEQGEPLDLSLSVLRAASPFRLNYLRTMGVRASLSISIVLHGALWGLIDCHHEMPRRPSFERLSLAELFALMLAMCTESRECRQILDDGRRSRDLTL